MEKLPEPKHPSRKQKSLVASQQRAELVRRNPEVINISPVAANEDSEQGGLLEYWSVLRRNKGTIIILTVIGGVLGYLYTMPQTPIYQAHAAIEIENLNQNFLNLNMKETNPTQTGMAGTEISDIQTQIRIFQSKPLIQRVVAKLKTAESSKPVEGRFAAWRKALNLPAGATVDPREQALQTAMSTLKVRAAGSTRIVELLVDSTDPAFAANFANTLANEYIDQNLESRWKTTERTTEWLSRQLDGMRIRLEQSDDQLQGYAREAGLVFTDEKTNVSSDKLRQIQTSLTAAQSDRVIKQARFEMASSSPPDALPDVVNDEGLREYQTKMTDLRRQIAELKANFTADYPKVKQAEAQYAVLEAAMTRERGAILGRIKNEFEEANRREQLIAAQYAEQGDLVSDEGGRAIQYNILKREVDSNRQLYDMMLQQLKQANVSSALRANNVRVVEPAEVPTQPYKPDPNRSGLMGLMGGFVVGAAFVIMRDRADRTLKDPGETSTYLHIPELGVIPNAYVQQAEKLRQLDVPAQLELTAYQSKSSPMAEAFRSTLISILFSAQQGSPPKVIVVTSAGPSEGKSTVLINLGISIAEVGQKVLIIDADLRKPRVHGVFGCEATPGLTELLRQAGSREPNAFLSGAIRETEVPGLYILPSGKATTAATSLLYGPLMSQTIKELRTQFDTILIDSPPMLQIPDARVLGRLADEVILVVRSRKTSRDAAQAALKKFKEDGIEVLGTILNDWNPKQSAQGYYGYYGKYYRDYVQYYQSPDGKQKKK